MLQTETPSSAHPDLDLYELPQLVSVFIEDQVGAVDAVRRAGPQLAAAVAAALPRIQAGGRLLYAGAGTSGRLGVLDSVELYPTFSWPRERALAVIAGGPQAMFVAIEGAEDDEVQGAADINALLPAPTMCCWRWRLQAARPMSWARSVRRVRPARSPLVLPTMPMRR